VNPDFDGFAQFIAAMVVCRIQLTLRPFLQPKLPNGNLGNEAISEHGGSATPPAPASAGQAEREVAGFSPKASGPLIPTSQYPGERP
jgi:hypothetical protein